MTNSAHLNTLHDVCARGGGGGGGEFVRSWRWKLGEDADDCQQHCPRSQLTSWIGFLHWGA